MGRKRTRDKHLAKLAVRRQAERRARRRKRNSAIAVGLVVALIAGGAAYLVISTGDETQNASSQPSSTASAKPGGVACGAEVPKAAGEKKPTFSKPPQMAIDTGATYTATMETSCGAIEVELDARSAPENVNSFVSLADEGYFDGLTFHRIAGSIDVIQGGDPSGDGTGSPGYQLKDELSGKEKYTTGAVAMANSGPDTAGSQFFIVTGPKAAQLPPSYTIIGTVTDGLDVAKKIQDLPVEGETPTQTVYIDSVSIDET